MTYYPSKIEALRLVHESSFGADMSGSLGSYAYCPFREGSLALELNDPLESPMHVQQRVDGHPVRIHLPRNAKLSFDVNLETFTTKATSTVAATQSWLGLILETAMGGINLMTGTTVNDAAADQDDWDATVATTLRPGAAVGVATTAGLLEAREIKSKSGSNIVLKHYTTNSPSNGATVYGSATYFCNPRHTGAESQSIGAVVEGYTTTDKWILMGGHVTELTFTLAPGAVPVAKVVIEFADWAEADGSDAAADLDGAILDAATYTNVNTLVQADSEFCTATVATANSVTKLHVSSMEIVPAMQWVKVKTPGGLNNVKQFVRAHAAPVVSGTFTLPYEDQTWFDRRAADTALALWFQVGSTPSEGAIVFSAPKIQVTNVERVDVEGVSGLKVSWVGRLDTDTTAESSYEGLAESAFRIHML